MTTHPYRLRPYHNPRRVDESKVPEGWRFRYAEEAHKKAIGPCRAWVGFDGKFSQRDDYLGIFHGITYIVPVTP